MENHYVVPNMIVYPKQLHVHISSLFPHTDPKLKPPNIMRYSHTQQYIDVNVV